jgi:hypothetical protein
MRSKLVCFFAGALVALISSAATRALDAQPVRKKGSHVNLSAEDYIEIQQLMSMYSRDVDPGSARDASWMFAKDARAVISGPPMLKPEDFKHFYSGLVGPDGQAALGGVRHFNTSYVIVGLPDGTARGSSYMMGVTTREKGARPEIQLFGKYEDLYVKTPDGWRMKERIWRSDSFAGSRQEVLPSPIPGNPKTYTTGVEAALQRSRQAGQARDAHGAPVPNAPPAGAPAAPAEAPAR